MVTKIAVAFCSSLALSYFQNMFEYYIARDSIANRSYSCISYTHFLERGTGEGWGGSRIKVDVEYESAAASKGWDNVTDSFMYAFYKFGFGVYYKASTCWILQRNTHYFCSLERRAVRSTHALILTGLRSFILRFLGFDFLSFSNYC